MKYCKKISAFLLASIILFSNFNLNVYASESAEVVIDEMEEKPEYFEGRLEGHAPAEFYGMSSRAALGSVHASKFKGYKIDKGVDVSYHNGTINWKKVKNAGIDFAIVRVGARSVSTGKMIYDYMSPENIKGAQAAGLDVGVYFYSQAINKTEAIEEAKYVLKKIKGYKLQLPVVFDYEYYYENNYKGRLQRSKMTDRQRTNVCHAFCETIEAAGYDAMIYANRSMLTDDLYVDELDKKYEIWLAEWASKSIYKNDYTYWQYSATGHVNGIPSQNVDMNYRYYLPKKADFDVDSRTETSMALKWKEIEGAEGYNLYLKLNDGIYELLSKNEGFNNTTYLHEGLEPNKEYTYKLSYYYLNENGEEVEVESEYPELTKNTLVKLKKPVITAEALDAGRIKLTWKPVEYADGYIIQQYSSTEGKYKTVKTIEKPNVLSYTRIGMKLGTTFKYRVKAFVKTNDGTVYSSYSSVKSVTTDSKLLRPQLESTGKTYSKITLKWNRIYGAQGYQIQRYDRKKGKFVTIKKIADGKTVTYTDKELTAKTSYQYKVRAYAVKSGKTVYSIFSKPITVKTNARVGTPKLNVTTKTYTSLLLQWNKVSYADGYEIERYDETKNEYVTIKTITKGSTTSYVNTYLNSEKSYKYRMRSYRILDGKKRYSFYSNVKSAETGNRRMGLVIVDALNVRSGAGTTYNKIGLLRENDEVFVIGSRKDWYRIRFEYNGTYKIGYVSKEYLKLM